MVCAVPACFATSRFTLHRASSKLHHLALPFLQLLLQYRIHTSHRPGSLFELIQTTEVRQPVLLSSGSCSLVSVSCAVTWSDRVCMFSTGIVESYWPIVSGGGIEAPSAAKSDAGDVGGWGINSSMQVSCGADISESWRCVTKWWFSIPSETNSPSESTTILLPLPTVSSSELSYCSLEDPSLSLQWVSPLHNPQRVDRLLIMAPPLQSSPVQKKEKEKLNFSPRPHSRPLPFFARPDAWHVVFTGKEVLDQQGG